MLEWLKPIIGSKKDLVLDLMQTEAHQLAYFYANERPFSFSWVDGELLQLVKDGQEFPDDFFWDKVDELKFHPQHQGNFRRRFVANFARPIAWKYYERVLKVMILREINKNLKNWGLDLQ